MPYVDNADARVYFETHGQGEPLLLIMGLGGHSRSWAFQVPALAQHYRVITIDNRGAGLSDKPPGPYTMELFADDVRAVLDAAGVESAHIVGASMGGLIAQEFYHRHPERVRSLVLACTGVGANDPAFVYAEQRVVDALFLDREKLPPRAVMQAICDVFYHPDFMAAVPDLVDRVLAQSQAFPQPPHAFKAQLEACLTHTPNSPRLKNIRVPTLVLHGEDDIVWPLANADYLVKHIPKARLHLIPKSAHMFMLEKPQAFNAAVLEFLAGNAAKAA